MMGTGPFAVPTFAALLDSSHEVVALVTRPAKPMHGKTAAEANPMRELAESRGVPILAPEGVNTPEAQAAIAQLKPDLLVVCDYGQILKPETLALAKRGGINLHGSLLPAYRGAAPINWAIYHGETVTGVTVIHMTPQLDAGPAIAKGELAIDPDITAAEIEPLLSNLGVPLVLDSISNIELGSVQSIPQDPVKATTARRLKKSDGEIDWRRSAIEIKNQIRALQPWPKAFTLWQHEKGEPVRLILDQTALGNEMQGEPGVVLQAHGDQLIVATGSGVLRILQIRPAGKKSQSVAEFLRGYHLKAGDRLGNS
jgi:methionyl-tRNA formyltransferase